MARPIPRKLLIHSATHQYGEKATDNWANEPWSENRELQQIRIEPTSKIVKTKENTELQLALLLFFDAQNSLPKDVIFGPENLDNGLVWNGTPYTIKSVEPLYDEARLHHYEIGLV